MSAYEVEKKWTEIKKDGFMEVVWPLLDLSEQISVCIAGKQLVEHQACSLTKAETIGRELGAVRRIYHIGISEADGVLNEAPKLAASSITISTGLDSKYSLFCNRWLINGGEYYSLLSKANEFEYLNSKLSYIEENILRVLTEESSLPKSHEGRTLPLQLDSRHLIVLGLNEIIQFALSRSTLEEAGDIVYSYLDNFHISDREEICDLATKELTTKRIIILAPVLETLEEIEAGFAAHEL